MKIEDDVSEEGPPPQPQVLFLIQLTPAFLYEINKWL